MRDLQRDLLFRHPLRDLLFRDLLRDLLLRDLKRDSYKKTQHKTPTNRPNIRDLTRDLCPHFDKRPNKRPNIRDLRVTSWFSRDNCGTPWTMIVWNLSANARYSADLHIRHTYKAYI